MRWFKWLVDYTVRTLTNERGDFGTTIESPDPPDPANVSREAVETELELGPQLARQKQQLREELSPEDVQLRMQLLEEYGPGLGEAMFEARRAMAPALTGLETQTAEQIAGRLGETDEDLLGAYQREFRAAEANAGRLGAPVGSVNLARQTVQAREGIRQSRINEALAATGKVPVTASPQAQPITPNTQSQFVGPFLGMSSNTYNTQSNLAAQQAAINQQTLGAGMGAIGTMGGAFLGGL